LRQYKSIQEIDKHLKILRLQADIHKQRTEIDVKYIKHGLRPTNLLAELFATLGQKQLYRLALKLLFKKFKF
jgi:hypothetical protein